MQTQIRDLLRLLYGEPTAAQVVPQLDTLIARYRRILDATGTLALPRPLDQHDALLITYGDQVTEPSAPPLQTLGKFLSEQVGDLVSGVHLLPFFPYSSDDGFSVIDYYAVNPAFGSWEDIARIGSRFDLMFDAVINHISASSVWFQKFLSGDPHYRDFFIAVEGNPDLSRVIRPRTLPLLTSFQTKDGEKKVWTTFSADQVDLNYGNPRVLLAVLEVLFFYAAQGARFIRLDAIAFLWKEIGTTSLHLPQTHAVIQLIRAVLDQVAPGVMLITETNVPHLDNISYFGNGGNEAQLVYNFALPPLTLHALLTGNAQPLTAWASTLSLPSPTVTFFNFLASHDGIGLNPVRGILPESEIDRLVTRALEHGGLVSYKNNPDGTRSPYELNITYFDALSNPAANEPLHVQIDRFMCSQAIMLALAGVPGIYFHSLFGSRNDRAGAEQSGQPRRINRQKFNRAELQRELDEPQSVRARVLARYAELLRARRTRAAFSPTAAQNVLPLDPRFFILERIAADGSSRTLCIHNVSDASVKLSWIRDSSRLMRDLLTGQELALGDIFVSPYQVLWLEMD